MRGEYINGDCMDYLPQYEDNHFDLAIVDPPYGIGITKQSNFAGGKRTSLKKQKQKDPKTWDNHIPDEGYFDELFRVSKNQIIWGANYFDLPPTKGIIIWDKGQRGLSQSDGELAWSSQKNLRIWTKNRVELLIEGTIHPTQKPVKLYEWLLTNYAKEGNLILDTHVGSASSLIACEDMKFNYVGFELDEEYYNASMKRLQDHINQLTLF